MYLIVLHVSSTVFHDQFTIYIYLINYLIINWILWFDRLSWHWRSDPGTLHFIKLAFFYLFYWVLASMLNKLDFCLLYKMVTFNLWLWCIYGSHSVLCVHILCFRLYDNWSLYEIFLSVLCTLSVYLDLANLSCEHFMMAEFFCIGWSMKDTPYMWKKIHILSD